MSLWVRNEKRLNMQCSKIISKDVRAVRSECATQKPRRALRITRLLFEILLLCLRRTQLGRKSTKIHPKWTQIDEKSILDRFGRPRPLQGRVRMRLGRLWGTQMPPQSRSWGALGSPRVAKSRQKAPPGQPRDAPRARGAIPKTSASAARIAQRS